MSKIKILVVPSDKGGVGNFRSIKPHMHLESKYPDDFFIDIDYSPDFTDKDYMSQYDIVHYHKKLGSFAETEKNVNMLNDMGIIPIMDIDDYWVTDKNIQDTNITNNLRSAKIITTTTPIIADEVSKINGNVTVLPNAIDPTEKQYTHTTEPSDRVRIGWLGGSSHLKDLELLKGLVSKLNSDKLMDKIQFVLCGFDLSAKTTYLDKETGQLETRSILPIESVWYQYEKIFTNDYKSVSEDYKKHLIKYIDEEYDGVDNEPYRRVWTKPVNSYASNYRLFDISLAPLVDNKFNMMKSELKAIEAGFYKKAIIAQDFGPYQLVLDNAYVSGGGFDLTKNALMVSPSHNHKGWYKHIKKLVQNPHLITELGQNLYETVSEKYSLVVVGEKRRNLYKLLVDNK